jgi:hypothetical protein
MTETVIIRGGLGDIATATAGDHAWHRRPGEAEREFVDRVRVEASALALPHLIVGGLDVAPRTGCAFNTRAFNAALFNDTRDF